MLRLFQVHIPVSDSSKGTNRGFAYVLFEEPDSAISAYEEADGKPFQGRILHIIPGQSKPKKHHLSEFELSQLPLKKQNLLRRKMEADKRRFQWNSLFMNQDAVLASTADRLGVSKSELLDPTSTDAAVKQAVAETQVIQETKEYFAAHGVHLDAFKSEKKGDTAILVKNFPYGTTLEELRKLFEDAAGGNVLQVLMPPSKTLAIVHFSQPVACRTAFAKLAYKRLGTLLLKLEKAPAKLFADQQAIAQVPTDSPAGVQKISGTELLQREDEQGDGDTTSLYVRNLNFDTTTAQLVDAFKSLDGFVSAQVKTKMDPKKPGQVLSMGFGFAHFRSKAQAEAALKVMDGYVLDGHTLGVKTSHKGHDAAEERRREDKAKKSAGQRTKIVVKNLAFEASKADVRRLLGTYGKLRVVRIPRKADNSSYVPSTIHTKTSHFTDRDTTDEDLPLLSSSRLVRRRTASRLSTTLTCWAGDSCSTTPRPRPSTLKRKLRRCRKRLAGRSIRWHYRSSPGRVERGSRSGMRTKTTHDAQVSLKRVFRVDENLARVPQYKTRFAYGTTKGASCRYLRIVTCVSHIHPSLCSARKRTGFLWGSMDKNKSTRCSSLLIPMLCKACLLLISFACLAKPDTPSAHSPAS